MSLRSLLQPLPWVIDELNSYTLKNDAEQTVVSNLIDKFQELSSFFPDLKPITQRKTRGLPKVERKEIKAKETHEVSPKNQADNKKDQLVGDIRRILTDVMVEEEKEEEKEIKTEAKQSTTPSSPSPYSKDFYALIFKTQLALARRFPTNAKVDYDLILLPSAQKIDSIPVSSISNNSVLLQKIREDICAFIPHKGKLTFDAKEAKPSTQFKKILLRLLPEDSKTLNQNFQAHEKKLQERQKKLEGLSKKQRKLEEKKSAITSFPLFNGLNISLSDQPTPFLIDTIRHQCGYPPIENKFEDDIDGAVTTFTPDDPNVVAVSNGHLYFRPSLENYFTANNSYENKWAPTHRLPYGKLSKREYASLLLQGVQIHEEVDPERLQLLRGIAGGLRPDEEINFQDDPNLIAMYDDFPFLKYLDNHPLLEYASNEEERSILFAVVNLTFSIVAAIFVPFLPSYIFGLTLAITSFACCCIQRIIENNRRLANESLVKTILLAISKSLILDAEVAILIGFSIFLTTHLLPILKAHSLMSFVISTFTLSLSPFTPILIAAAVCLLQANSMFYCKKSLTEYIDTVAWALLKFSCYITGGAILGLVKALKFLTPGFLISATLVERTPMAQTQAPLNNSESGNLTPRYSIARRHSMPNLSTATSSTPTSSSASSNYSFAHSPFTLHSSHPSRQRSRSESSIHSITQRPALASSGKP